MIKLIKMTAAIALMSLSGCAAQPRVDLSGMPICEAAMFRETQIPLSSGTSPYWHSVAIDCDPDIKAGTDASWTISESIEAPPDAKLVGMVILKPRGAKPTSLHDSLAVKVADAKKLGADVLTRWENHPLTADGYIVYRAYKKR